MNTTPFVPTCICGSVEFRPVDIDRGPHRPLYRTEFEACSICGVMFHRRAKRTLFSPTAPLEAAKVERQPFRSEIDTTGWTPPPAKVWTDEP